MEKLQICYICKETFEYKHAKDKQFRTVRNHCHYTGEHRGAAHSICNLKYSVPKEISIAFHNESNYDYNFIIKGLVEEFEKHFICLGESTETYITFSGPKEKEVKRIDKKENEITKAISYRLQFINNARFMASSLSSFVKNLPEGILKLNVNLDQCLHEF